MPRDAGTEKNTEEVSRLSSHRPWRLSLRTRHGESEVTRRALGNKPRPNRVSDGSLMTSCRKGLRFSLPVAASLIKVRLKSIRDYDQPSSLQMQPQLGKKVSSQ